jgi:hypothetical protein
VHQQPATRTKNQLPGGIGLPALTPYDASIPLSGITGTKRDEVIGATPL